MNGTATCSFATHGKPRMLVRCCLIHQVRSVSNRIEKERRIDCPKASISGSQRRPNVPGMFEAHRSGLQYLVYLYTYTWKYIRTQETYTHTLATLGRPLRLLLTASPLNGHDGCPSSQTKPSPIRILVPQLQGGSVFLDAMLTTHNH